MKKINFTVVSALGIHLLITGCGTISHQSKIMEKENVSNISKFELRNRLTNFTIYFAKNVERAADDIILRSDDPRIRMNALRWKINSIPASQYALFLNDPMAALIDIATFCIQMDEFFRVGNGKEIFGNCQEIAIQASTVILKEQKSIWTRISETDEPLLREDRPLYSWAATYPIEDLSFTRKSISDTLLMIYGIQEVSLQETVEGIAESIFDIRERLSIYSDFLPRQARWQAEYLISEKLADQNIEAAFKDLNRITNSFEEITLRIQQGEALATDLQIKTMNDLRKERDFILAAVSTERVAVLNEIDRQRTLTINEFQSIASTLGIKLIEKAELRAYDLIDHFFIRLFELILLTGIILLAIIFLFRKYKTGQV